MSTTRRTIVKSLGRLMRIKSFRVLFCLLVVGSLVTICLWSVWVGRVARVSFDAVATSAIPVAEARDHLNLTLCGRVIDNMPAPRHNESLHPYGVHQWERNLSNAIVLPNAGDIYGRTGNQIQEFFHAFDMARDRGGALVLHERGFPVDLTLSALYLGIGKAELQNRFGVTFYEDIEPRQRSNLIVLGETTRAATDQLYHYISNDTRFAIDHRRYAIQELYRLTAREMQLRPDSKGAQAMCSSIHAFFGKDGKGQMDKAMLNQLRMDNLITQKYTVIHSRGLESLGRKFLEEAHKRIGVDNRAAFEFPAEMVTSILSPLEMTNNSIVMIGDGQNKKSAKELKAAFGPTFQVVPQQVSTVSGDIMLAILSNVFIGNPVSTFSQYIAQARYALGIGNSYLFARKSVESGRWETFCNDEPCFYDWLHLWAPMF